MDGTCLQVMHDWRKVGQGLAGARGRPYERIPARLQVPSIPVLTPPELMGIASQNRSL